MAQYQWFVGDFCFFTTPTDHPTPHIRKIGKIISLSTPYSQDGNQYLNCVIEDFAGKWEIKCRYSFYNSIGNYTLDEISGFNFKEDFDDLSEEDEKFFTKPAEFFQNIVPSAVNLTTHLVTSQNVDIVKKALSPARYTLHHEDMLCWELQRLIKLYEKVMYTKPHTLTDDRDDFCHADSKQGCFYSTLGTYEDVLFQFQLDSSARKNFKRNPHSDYIDVKRKPLSTDRMEELRIAIVMITENIRSWICCGTSGDEDIVSEREYIEVLKEIKNIRDRNV